MEFDRPIEAADADQRVTADGEIAAVENGPELQRVMHEDVRGRRDDEIVQANQRPAAPVPVIETVRPGDRDEGAVPIRESALEPFDPPDWGAAVGVDERQDVAARRAPRGFPRDHQALARLVDDANARYVPRGGPRVIRAGVVHDDD